MHSYLKAYGLIKISGMGAQKFLQGQVTINIEKLQPQQFTLTAHCNPQGRIISLFYVGMHADFYYLIIPQEIIPIALTAFKKYSIFYKIHFEDCSSSYYIYATTNNKHGASNSDLYRTLLPIQPELYFILSQIEMTEPDDNWEQFEIQNRLPRLYPATSEKFLAQELDLDQLNAISYDKGCYTGQEIIARIHYRGRIKSALYKISFSNECSVSPGKDIFYLHNNEEIKCAELVSLYPGTDCNEGLMVCEISHAKPNNLFFTRNNSFININDSNFKTSNENRHD